MGDLLQTTLISNPAYFFSLFVLLLARIMPIVALLPFLGAKVLPNPAKVTLSVCLAVLLFPYALSVSKVGYAFNMHLLFLFAKELTYGFIFGFLALAPFTIAQMAGIVIDHQRGSSSLMVNDPTMSVQVSTIGLLYSYMTVCIFFWIDGPFIFLDALVKSYAVLPPDMLPSPALLHLDSSFMKVVLGFLAYLTAISCQLAAPALIMILMSNVFLGIMNRLAPQVQITFLGLSLNAYLGDLALWAAWYFIIDRLGVEALKWMQNLTSLLESVVLAQ